MVSDTHMRGTPWGASRAHVTTLLYGPHPVGGDRTRLCRRGVQCILNSERYMWAATHTLSMNAGVPPPDDGESDDDDLAAALALSMTGRKWADFCIPPNFEFFGLDLRIFSDRQK